MELESAESVEVLVSVSCAEERRDVPTAVEQVNVQHAEEPGPTIAITAKDLVSVSGAKVPTSVHTAVDMVTVPIAREQEDVLIVVEPELVMNLTSQRYLVNSMSFRSGSHRSAN